MRMIMRGQKKVGAREMSGFGNRGVMSDLKQRARSPGSPGADIRPISVQQHDGISDILILMSGFFSSTGATAARYTILKPLQCPLYT